MPRSEVTLIAGHDPTNRGEVEAAIEDLEAACKQGDRNDVDVALNRLWDAGEIDDSE